MDIIKINGLVLKCDVCGYTDFGVTDAQLNTRLLSAFHLDFLNKSAKIFVCQQCLNVQWFLINEYEDSRGSNKWLKKIIKKYLMFMNRSKTKEPFNTTQKEYK